MKRKTTILISSLLTVSILLGLNFVVPAEEEQIGMGPVRVEVSCEEFQAREDITKSVKLAEHDRLEVNLCSNPSTGYQWPDSPRISNHIVLWQTSHRSSSSSGGTLGAPGEDKWVFRALDEGKSTVYFKYARSWKGGDKDGWSLRLHVNVIDEDDLDSDDIEKTEGKSLGEKMVRGLYEDIKNHNRPNLENKISENFQGISESEISGRKRELKVLRDSKLEDYTLSDFNSTRRNDTLIVTYKLKAEETIRGEEADDDPVTQLSVFVKTDSGWKWIAQANAD